MRNYFAFQKKFSTIMRRAFAFSLIDFPIVTINFFFIMSSILVYFSRVLFRSSKKPEKWSYWLSQPKGRNGRLTRLLPPYQTFSGRAKLKSFQNKVIIPLKEKYPSQVRSIKTEKAEEILTEILTRWEKLPNLIEYFLYVPLWAMGIKFLGLDPKTVFYNSIDPDTFYRVQEFKAKGLQKLYLKAKWYVDDKISFWNVSIPLSFTLEFIAVGLIAYIILVIIIEFISAQIYYREGIEKKLVEKIIPTFKNDLTQKAYLDPKTFKSNSPVKIDDMKGIGI